jgi:hypothetical protein
MGWLETDSSYIKEMPRDTMRKHQHVMTRLINGSYLFRSKPSFAPNLALVNYLRGGMDGSHFVGRQSGKGNFRPFNSKGGGRGGSSRWKSAQRYFHKRRSEWEGGGSEPKDGHAKRWGKWGGLHEPADEESEDASAESASAASLSHSKEEGSSESMEDSNTTDKQASITVSGAVVASEMPSHPSKKINLICKQAVPIASRPEDVDGEKLRKTLQDVFGYKDFRGRQEEVVRRILCGLSTIFISATGSGKSLCYLVPAVMSPGIVIVISPLIALIQDQIKNLPDSLHGAAMHSMLTQAQNARVLSELQAGKVKVLFLSPERLFSESFLGLAALLPPISFVCVDEVCARIACACRSRVLVESIMFSLLMYTCSYRPYLEAVCACACTHVHPPRIKCVCMSDS